MHFLEKDLETIIWESDNMKLQQKNLPIEGKKTRQLRIGNYGTADIVTFKRSYKESVFVEPYLTITIFEFKKEQIGIAAFLQSLKYAKGIKDYLELKKPKLQFILEIVLCAKKIDTSGEFIYIPDLVSSKESFGCVNSISFYTFEYLIDGINFIEHSGYELTNKGF